MDEGIERGRDDEIRREDEGEKKVEEDKSKGATDRKMGKAKMEAKRRE